MQTNWQATTAVHEQADPSTEWATAERDIPIRLQLALALITLSFLALIGLQTYQWMRRSPRLVHDRELLARTSKIIDTAYALKTALQDAERGQRGYLLTGETTYLEPYRNGTRNIPVLLARLRQLTSGVVEQQRRMPILAQEIGIKLDQMQRALDAYESEGLGAAQQVLRNTAGLDAIRSINDMIDATVETESKRLAKALAGTAQDERETAHVALASSALACALMVLGVVLTLLAFRHARRLNAQRRTDEQRFGQELAKVQAALAQAQKMDALGQLTSGVTHDFNNFLQAIRIALAGLKYRIGIEDQVVCRCLDTAISSADRAANTVARLLAFARQQPLTPKLIDANELISSMGDLLPYTLGNRITLKTVFGSELWWVSADANQLETAILNLAVNARDAMPEGGTLVIETANALLDESHTKLQPSVSPGHYVLITVSDTGIGMTQEVLTRAFDPFFTTKAAGRGTGLGLSQVFGFINQSGGHVALSSKPGAGTTVKLYLPRSTAKLSEGIDGERMTKNHDLVH